MLKEFTLWKELESHQTKGLFFKKDQSRPLFCLFSSFSNYNSNNTN